MGDFQPPNRRSGILGLAVLLRPVLHALVLVIHTPAQQSLAARQHRLSRLGPSGYVVKFLWVSFEVEEQWRDRIVGELDVLVALVPHYSKQMPVRVGIGLGCQSRSPVIEFVKRCLPGGVFPVPS